MVKTVAVVVAVTLFCCSYSYRVADAAVAAVATGAVAAIFAVVCHYLSSYAAAADADVSNTLFNGRVSLPERAVALPPPYSFGKQVEIGTKVVDKNRLFKNSRIKKRFN